MSREATSETDQAAGVIPAAVWRVKAISVLPAWRLAVTFNDGLAGIVDLSELVNGPDAGVFEALRDPAFFDRAHVECGAVTWPNGADLAPDGLYKDISRCGFCEIRD